MIEKQKIRNYIFDSKDTDLTMNKVVEMGIIFSDDLSDYSITNTSMTTLSDGKVLLVVIFSKDEHTS